MVQNSAVRGEARLHFTQIVCLCKSQGNPTCISHREQIGIDYAGPFDDNAPKHNGTRIGRPRRAISGTQGEVLA